jgi:hypothetical protein
MQRLSFHTDVCQCTASVFRAGNDGFLAISLLPGLSPYDYIFMYLAKKAAESVPSHAQLMLSNVFCGRPRAEVSIPLYFTHPPL